MRRLYRKSRLIFSLVWIGIYILTASAGDILSRHIGKEKLLTLIFLALISAILLFFLWKNRLFAEYGLCKPRKRSDAFLYYIPLFFLSSVNMWFSPKEDTDPAGSLLFVLSMCFAGFLEEVIFRGLLYKAMEKNGRKTALAVSSITFGMGHIINLFNGNSESLASTLCQICCCTAIGFLFVVMFHGGGSIIPQIISHCVINATSVFSDTSLLSVPVQIISAAVVTVTASAYGIYILKTANGDKSRKSMDN